MDPPEGEEDDGILTTTLTLSVYWLLAVDMTVMTALPLATAVTVPVLLTVATAVFDDDHLTAAALLFVSVRACVWPFFVSVMSLSAIYSVRF